LLIVGCSIGTTQTSNVVVDTAVSNAYEAQPGRQEWVTVIECVSVTGEKIPPYIIFKGQNLMTSWLPRTLPKGWRFAANASGWTNNFHGMEWIKHFHSATWKQLQSPDDYRLLLCDGHDSHISADLVSFCIHNRIDLILLPPHSSHLLQPLDVGVFAPLKRAISIQISRFIRSGIARIQKVEWLERFIEAREHGITKENIISGWRGAGLFPENMHRILIQLTDYEESAVPDTPLQPHTTQTSFFPNSSRPDPSTLHSINQAFLTEISNINIGTPFKTHVRRLNNLTEQYQAENVILKSELHEVKEINGLRKERQGGKRMILKGIPVASTEEVEKALRKAEEATKAKTKGKVKRTKHIKKRVISSEDETDSSTDDGTDVSEPLVPEILDCIEVAES
jgi:DDE superfamily endonuclease